MPSPNLAIAHVTASQNQKEVTIIDAIDALDRAMTDTLALDLSAGPLTVSATQLRAAMVLRPAGALTGPASLLVPQIRRVFALLNTDTAFAISVERGASAILVQPGESALLISDGTPEGLFRVGPGAPAYDPNGTLRWRLKWHGWRAAALRPRPARFGQFRGDNQNDA